MCRLGTNRRKILNWGVWSTVENGRFFIQLKLPVYFVWFLKPKFYILRRQGQLIIFNCFIPRRFGKGWWLKQTVAMTCSIILPPLPPWEPVTVNLMKAFIGLTWQWQPLEDCVVTFIFFCVYFSVCASFICTVLAARNILILILRTK